MKEELKIAACALAALACARLAAAPDEVSYSRQRLFSGFDGKMCKIQPSIATDGSGTVLLSWQNLLLTGSDVFYGESMAKSTDGGRTFGPGVDQKIFADTREGKIRTTYYGTVNYSRKNRKWFGLGAAQRYVNDKVPMLKSVDGRPATFPMYYTVDPEKGAFTSRHELQVPFEYARTLPFGQKLECENGDLLVPFYVIPKKNDANHKSYCVVTRCRFEGEMLKVVSAGTPLADDTYPRGIGEPSLAKLNGKYYLTLRTDVQGLWSESDDGVTFSKPRPWRWDDGSLLENYNTQQHWLRPDGALYLAYTRRGAHNDHVFRHRAPIFMAKFDPARGCLVRATEKILVPELGARLGNFNVIDYAPDESWLITAEWMQPLGCERYGSDNSLWLARVKFKVGRPSRGALCLTFDDRHFANWQRARAVFKKHGAHATFFVYRGDRRAGRRRDADAARGRPFARPAWVHARARGGPARKVRRRRVPRRRDRAAARRGARARARDPQLGLSDEPAQRRDRRRAGAGFRADADGLLLAEGQARGRPNEGARRALRADCRGAPAHALLRHARAVVRGGVARGRHGRAGARARPRRGAGALRARHHRGRREEGPAQHQARTARGDSLPRRRA